MNKLYSLFSRNQLFAFAIVMTSIAGGLVQGNFVYADGLLEEIIVTAQKREQSVYDVPMSVVALGATELNERGIDSWGDLVLAVPSLDSQDNGSSRRIFIRGIGNILGTSSPIGVYLDETPLSGGQPTLQLDLHPYDLERVEVLRGPQGTLYGQGSMGGTIRFITKNPQLDRFGAKARVAAAFIEDGAPGQKIQGAINVPLIEDELGIRIAGTFEHAGGWIDQPVVSQSDINDQNLTDVRVKGLWQPSEALQVNAMAHIYRNDVGARNQGEDDSGNYTQLFDQSTTPSAEDDYDIYNLTLTYDFDSVQLLNTTSYITVKNRFSQWGNVCCAVGQGFHLLYPTYLISQDIFSEELRLSYTGSGPWQWTVGGFYQDAEISPEAGTYYFGLPGALPPPFTFLNESASSKSWAVFGDTSYALTERLELGAGLRYFKDDRELFSAASTFGGVPVTAATTQTGTFDSLSPRVYVNYDITGNVKAYASAAKGFRSGGFNSLGFPAYDPESVWTYELGTKMSLFEDQLDAEIALFYSEYTDYLEFGLVVINNAPASIFSNAGDAEIKGVEWAFMWRATDNLSLSFNGNYLDTELVEIRATGTAHAVGDRLDHIPKYNYTLSANYDFSLGSKPGYARLDYNQQGRSIWANMNPSDVINMLNIHTGWEWNDDLSFEVFVQNILNDRDFVSPASALRFSARPQPRTVGIGIGVEFN
ncbi:TonB-dependent receptor [Porticoccaceae bacterium]|nr:TonB-dependent receptor [Porticoccaceae bacterium]